MATSHHNPDSAFWGFKKELLFSPWKGCHSHSGTAIWCFFGTVSCGHSTRGASWCRTPCGATHSIRVPWGQGHACVMRILHPPPCPHADLSGWSVQGLSFSIQCFKKNYGSAVVNFWTLIISSQMAKMLWRKTLGAASLLWSLDLMLVQHKFKASLFWAASPFS